MNADKLPLGDLTDIDQAALDGLATRQDHMLPLRRSRTSAAANGTARACAI